MISQAMQGFVNNSSAIRAMFEEGKRLAGIYGAENVYDFSLGNPSTDPPAAVKDALIQILTEEAPTFVHGYTNNAGYEDVRAFVAEATNREFGTRYSMEQVVMTNGAAGALNIICKTLLNPGDQVIVFAPFFGEYNAYVGNYGGQVVVVPSDPETFQIDPGALEAAVTPKTKAVIINTPNNPTGVVYAKQTIAALAAVLEDKQKEFGHPIYLISDEPYRYLAYDGVEVPYVPRFYRNTFVAYSFSKSLSLPGERIGYILLHPEADDAADILAALSVANRICGFVNAPSLFQRVLPYCMNLRTDIGVYDKNRGLAYQMLQELGFACVKPEGAFYLFPKTPIPDDKAFCQAAKEERLLLVPGSAFGCPGHFRMSYCVAEATVRNARESFRRLAERFRG